MTIFSKAAVIPALWLLSFLGAFLIFPVSDSLQVAGVIAAVTAVTAYAFCTDQVTFRYSPLTILIGLLWAVAAISVIGSEVHFVSLTYFFFFSVFPLTFLLFSCADGQDVLKPIRFTILVLAVGSLIQFYFMPHMLKFGGAHWPLEDNNSLAVILASGAVMFVGQALKGGKWAKQNIAAAAIAFAGVMTTGGTAVFFAFFLVLGVMVWMAKPPSYKPVGLFMAAVVVLMFAMTTSDTSIYRFSGTWAGSLETIVNAELDEPNSISGARFLIWESALAIFKAHIWTGTGIGTFFLYYPEFRHIADDSAGFAAHNDLVQFAAEMGFAAPLLAVMIVGFVIYRTVQKLSGMGDASDRLKIIIPFAVFGLIIGHSLVNFNMYVLPTLMMVGLMLAVWNAQTNTKTDTKTNTKEMIVAGHKTVRESICFLVVISVLVPLWGCYLSEYYTVKAMDDLGNGNAQGFAENMNKADTWGMGQNGRTVLQAAQFSVAVNDTERALALLDRAEHLNPKLNLIYVERAGIWSVDQPQKGLDEAQRALKMDEGSLVARMMVVDILERMGQPDEAYEVQKAGLNGRMQSRNPESFYQSLAVKAISHSDPETSKIVLQRLRHLQRSTE